MLFISSDDFFEYVKNLRPLTIEEEKEFSFLLKNGDENAKNKLVDNYLPYVASIIKRNSRGKPSLELIYRAILDLINLLESYDFSKENGSFTRALSFKLRQTITKFIANS